MALIETNIIFDELWKTDSRNLAFSDTVNLVRSDPLRKLLLIVSYHFVRKAKLQPIRDAYSTNAISGEPRVGSSLSPSPGLKTISQNTQNLIMFFKKPV
jgi:hypothetical protein